ncbi:hypothetical protein ACJJTC_019376 [Scirpophaga incertulas]
MSDKYRKCVKCGASAMQHPELNFHSFPRAGKISNYARVRVWAEFCYPGENLSEEKLKGLYKSHKLICSRHFDRSAYTDQTMNRLNMNAVPTLENLHIFGSSQQSIEVTENVVVPQQMIRDISLPGTSQEQSEVLENVVVPQQMIRDISLPGTSQEQSEVLEVPSILELKQKQVQKCKKYINKIYRLKKALKLKKESKKNWKYILEAISESKYFEKLTNHLSPAFSLLLQSQLKNCSRKLNGRRWTLEQKIIALAMLKKSNSCYRLLRRLICLPNPNTLKSLLNKVQLPCGINHKVMAKLD